MNSRLGLVLMLAVVLPSLSSAQGFFPIQIGNAWQFYDDPMNPSYRNCVIVGDSVFSNGKTYAVSSNYMCESKFFRQEGSKVFAYGRLDSTEYLLLDFAATPGDTILRTSSYHSRIVLHSKSFNSYFHQTQWVFQYILSMPMESWTIIDSIGLFEVFAEPGVYWFLNGARINGVLKYGQILSTPIGQSSLPRQTAIYPCYPNPFNPSTSIRIYLASSSYASLRIYDLLGRMVTILHEGTLQAGEHFFRWTPHGRSSGTYICRLQAEGRSFVTKLNLIN